MTWTRQQDQALTVDHRGWKKGVRRLYTKIDEQRILRIHRTLDADPEEHFSGATAILQRYRQLFPNRKSISLRFIGRVLAAHGLSVKPKVRRKGVSRYLHYPEATINSLGRSLLEIDFIGKKFITGRTEPINFIAFSLRFPRKLKYFQRIEAETALETIKHCQIFFRRFEKPHVIKLDNGLAFAVAGYTPRSLNSLILFLLRKKIIPVFTAPRKPWNQASVEGANSIFSRKFWHRFEFQSLQEIDQRLISFNNAYQRYTEYYQPRRSEPRSTPFVPKVYFIRKVYEHPDGKHGYIDILKEHIMLRKTYINMFVLAAWDLTSDRLTVLYEHDKLSTPIKTIRFVLSPFAKNRVY